jgi:hypothetical protein
MSKSFFIDLNTSNLKERYALSKFLEFSDNFDPITSEFMNKLVSLKSSGSYQIAGEDARPELISNEIYGNTQYWWAIMFYNGITKVDDLVNGMVLKYPSSDDIEDLYFILKSKELGR